MTRPNYICPPNDCWIHEGFDLECEVDQVGTTIMVMMVMEENVGMVKEIGLLR